MHGTTMIFLFNTPVLAGFGNYLLPLHARRARHGVPPAQRVQLLDLPVRAGIFMYASFVVGKAPDGGWFAYVPLTDKALLARASTSTSGGSV